MYFRNEVSIHPSFHILTKSRLLVYISVLFMDIIMLECNNQVLDFAVPLSKMLTIEKSVKQMAPKPAITRAGTK